MRGILYGTTSYTIFKFDPATGIETTLYTFSGGGYPSTLLKLGTLLYGTTTYEGQAGTVFKFNPATGALKVLHAFTGSEGAYPGGPLIAVQGALYGTAQSGGASYAGTIFRIDPASGALTVLYDFANGSDGGAPCSPLIAISDVLYGGTCTGGAQNLGTIFRFQP